MTRLDKHIATTLGFPRDKSIELIKNGGVLVNDKKITKPSHKVSSTDNITTDLSRIYHFVSRAGDKLQDALTSFKIDVKGKVCLDIGASTGGFTDCLLQNEAKLVYAVDVGTDQLHPHIKSNPRVISFEKTDVRELDTDRVSKKIDIITIDVSFISSKKILESITKFIRQKTTIVLLYKPQYEKNCQELPAINKKILQNLKLVDKKKCKIKGKSGTQEELALLVLDC